MLAALVTGECGCGSNQFACCLLAPLSEETDSLVRRGVDGQEQIPTSPSYRKHSVSNELRKQQSGTFIVEVWCLVTSYEVNGRVFDSRQPLAVFLLACLPEERDSALVIGVAAVQCPRARSLRPRVKQHSNRDSLLVRSELRGV